MRQIRYQQISDSLRERLGAGEFDAGQVLPSEAQLRERYDASRVTIRKALEVLRNEGLVESRQGFGWMATAVPVAQPLTGLTTIESQLEASGRSPERRILTFGFVDAADVPPPAAKLGDRMLEVRRLNLADGHPFARVTVWCREDLGADLSRSQVASHSFYDLVSVDIGGATQTIGADVVSSDDADLLGVPAGSAVLTVERTTFDTGGTAI
ncbi:MAG: GntR family transcriptional regulator, partial [Acidimicrobiales bacterium]|nr:GntR family transcriptional regulator [Acidimicrobiales bacterium]